jgi:hydrogenase nickel incorporation protein HypB
MKKVPVVENLLKLNDEVAALNRERFRSAHVLVLDLIGATGCGKTALLEATLRELAGQLRMGVLVGDLTTTRDAERLARWCDQVVQINTGRGCHLEAHQVRQALDRIDLERLEVLVIENVGNLICPVGFDLGHDHQVGMFSVPEGEDKPAKHPHLVQSASALILNKMDLLPHLAFDREAFRRDCLRLHPDLPILEVSATTGRLAPWLAWLQDRVTRFRQRAQAAGGLQTE